MNGASDLAVLNVDDGSWSHPHPIYFSTKDCTSTVLKFRRDHAHANTNITSSKTRNKMWTRPSDRMTRTRELIGTRPGRLILSSASGKWSWVSLAISIPSPLTLHIVDSLDARLVLILALSAGENALTNHRPGTHTKKRLHTNKLRLDSRIQHQR